jgi:hypothetical protein
MTLQQRIHPRTVTLAFQLVNSLNIVTRDVGIQYYTRYYTNYLIQYINIDQLVVYRIRTKI